MCVRLCVCECECVCVRERKRERERSRSAPGSVFSLRFPVAFSLPRQFRGGPWASATPAPPSCLKTRPPRGPRSCPNSATRDAPCPTPRCAMGDPRRSVLLVLSLLLILLEVGCQKAADKCAHWCPKNSTCVSATSCRCHPGFATFNGDISNSPTELCEDINECVRSTTVLCGKLADCQNVEGSYYCTCNPGYELASGNKMFRNESENTCKDVDECQKIPRLCNSRSICVNTPGSYTCQCLPGFQNKPDNPKLCADEDECSSKTHQCHNSTYCVNTEGTYRCHCHRGWVPKAGFPPYTNSTVCEETSLPPWTPPSGISSQSLSHFFDKVEALRRDFKPATAENTIQKLVKSVDELLDGPGDLETLALPSRHHLATQLLLGLEDTLRTLAETLPGDSLTYVSPGDTELSLMIQEQGNGNVTVGQSHARMLLDWAVATRAGDSGPTVVGILSSKKMQKLLSDASLALDPEKKAELKETHQSPVRGAQLELLSAVNSVFLSNNDTEKLKSPVTIAFSHQPETPGHRQELLCAFWKGGGDKGGHWATTGCWRLGSLNGSTTCQCNHLSSFAILMAHYDVEDPKLALITKVGLVLSLVCLLFCILTFLLVRPIQGSRTTVHLHLCICLFVGSAIFLAGIENQGGQVGLRCRLVAGLLHYWFLAAFCWMSFEGLELYFLVVRVFQGQGLSKRWLYLLGYGVPGLIVAVSAAVNPQGYGRALYCWLDPARGFLWSFLGPVTVIVLFNAVIFVTTVWKLTQKFSEINPDMKKLKKARVLTITALAQLFVLGSTWVFGLFLFDPHSWILSYTFTILNCLQGLFLFLLHCLLNKKVREEYRKWACLVTGNKYSEFASTMSGTSHNQTRALRPSESGM
ncbi:adhesion G protein-coupled receptor E5 isoform X2 [Tamandua tetradactyla]|uniref:adhesion G protein-coupled receptor E5 isoform X2 n=1 Tax=Tamandua tetradactyla TaxID=48850 RepID=UPI004054437A